MVRDVRNPIVSCVVEPSSGHEGTDPPVSGRARAPRDVLVVGGGVAGLELARVAAGRGHRVVVRERAHVLGGAVRTAARGAGRERLDAIADWLEAECGRLGVDVEAGCEVTSEDVASFPGEVVLCTGSLPGRPTYEVDPGASRLTAADVLGAAAIPDGVIAVWDPIGGPIGISVAELLRAAGRAVHFVTPDLIAGNELSRSGDLAPANVRLLSAGVVLERRSVLRRVAPGEIHVEDRFTGEPRAIAAATLVDAGYRLPDDRLWAATAERVARAGDAVAPRSIHEAILEGRRAALSLDRVGALV
jgi:2,4-dienoyl-CoA reductase (NADPH2)